MKYLKLNSRICDSETKYLLEEIELMRFGNGTELGYSESDLAGNEVLPEEILMEIRFKDGCLSTFVASNWRISYC